LENPRSTNPAFTLSVRDPCGSFSFSFETKYVLETEAEESSFYSSSWEKQAIYLIYVFNRGKTEQEPTKAPDPPPEIQLNLASPTLQNIVVHNSDQIPDIAKTINPSEEDDFKVSESLTKAAIQQQSEIVMAYRKSSSYQEKFPVRPPPPPNKNDARCGYSLFSLFLFS